MGDKAAEVKTVKAYDIINEALEWARANNVRIIQGPIFDHCDPTNWRKRATVPGCSAIGAVLLKAGRVDEVIDLEDCRFRPDLLSLLNQILGESWPWIWRWNQGWDRNLVLNFDVTDKNGKERTIIDEVSRYASQLARQWCDKR